MMERLPPARSLAPLLAALAVILAVTGAPRTASALPVKFTGGMGLALWPLAARGESGPLAGFGAGINGRVMMQVGSYVRLQAGLLQAEFNRQDRTHVLRRIIGATVEAVRAPTERTYFTFGVRLGAENLEMIETLESREGSRRLISDVDRWAFVAEPLVTGGVQLAGRYHIELETGVVLSTVDGRFAVSYVAVLGVYFRMGGRRPH